MQRHVDPHAQERRQQRSEPAARVRVKDRGVVGGEAEKALRLPVLGKPPQKQPPVADFRLHAELPIGPVAFPVALCGKDRGKAKRDGQAPCPAGGEREGQAFAQLPLGTLPCERRAHAVLHCLPAAALLREFPFLRQIRLTSEREPKSGIVPLRAIDAGIAEKGGAFAGGLYPQAVYAV